MRLVKGLLFPILALVVGCDGVLGGTKRLDKCGVCGGDSTQCHIISGIFTRRNLQYGYNHVTTLPIGACNINITEMQPSRNYLALKLTEGEYFLNGNWALGYSNDYPGAGTTFTYTRPLPSDRDNPVEYILAPGPTNASVDIMILKQQSNRGVLYSYTIPMEKYVQVKGQDQPVTHPPLEIASPPQEPKFISKEDYTSQIAAHTGRDEQPQADEMGSHEDSDSRNERYRQAYLEEMRRRRQQEDTVTTKPSTRRHHSREYIQRLRENQRRRQQRIQQLYEQQQQQASGTPQVQPQQDLTPRDQSSDPQAKPQPGPNYGLRSNNQQSPPQQSPAQPGPNYGLRSNNQQSPPQQSAAQPGPNYGLRSNNQQSPAQQSAAQPGPNYGVRSDTRVVVPNQRASSDTRIVVPNQRQPNYGYPGGGSQYPTRGRYNQPSVVRVPHYQPNYPQQQYPYNRGGQQYPVQPQQTGAVNDQIPVQLGPVQRPHLGVLDADSDYSWKITGFTECSRACGEGHQQTVIVCVKVSSTAIVTDENCDNSIKPQTQSLSCNTHTCSPDWVKEEWGACSTTCDRGQQTRAVECQQRISDAIQNSISASRCPQSKPSIIKACNEDKPCVRWNVSKWSKCSSECGRGQRTRDVVCVNPEGQELRDSECAAPQPVATEICDMGSCAKTWFYSEWSTECSSTCGHGVYTRELYCSANSDRCRKIDKPDRHKPCRSDIPCGGKWFTGPWGKCTVTCGSGVVKRDLTCIKKLRGHSKLMAIVDEENCRAQDRPDTEQPCERQACQPQWYITDWTECSKSCDTGARTREVKCLTSDKVPTNECDVVIKPESQDSCNTVRCPVGETDPSCKDKFDNCLLVVQARLCHYDYYKNYCCLSCKSHEHHHGRRHHGNT